jgi:ADP-heptose:LPS heptosyltransferase
LHGNDDRIASGLRMSNPIQPLVIRFGRLGDMLLLQPMLRRLHARYGRPCHLLARGHYSAELYHGQPDVADVTVLDAYHRPFLLSPEQWRVVSVLRAMRHSPVYVAEPQPRSLARIRMLLKLAGIPESHCTFLTDIDSGAEGHWIEHLLQLADATPPAFVDRFARVAHATDAAPTLQVSAKDRAACDQWLTSRGLAGHPLVLLQTANKRTLRWRGVRNPSDDAKSWPIENWARVVAGITSQLPNARILLCGSPAEASYLESIRVEMAQPGVEVAARDLPLRRLKALLAVAHSMISVDTGPAHVAAAMQCPLVVMFGSEPPRYWAPRSMLRESVQVLGGPPLRHRVDAITPEEVIRAWSELPVRTSSMSPIDMESATTLVSDVTH